jgi:predicted amidophosphoribosyltransferase
MAEKSVPPVAPVEKKAAPPNTRPCPSCNNTIPANAVFCGFCGSAIQPQTPVAPKPKAEKKPVPAAAPAPAVKPAPAAPAKQPAPVQPKEKIPPKAPETTLCPACKKNIKPNIKFCPYCGAKIIKAPEPILHPSAPGAKAAPKQKIAPPKEKLADLETEETAPLKKCPSCKKDILKSAKFCGFCGAKT